MSNADLTKGIRYLIIGSILQFVAVLILDAFFLEVTARNVYRYDINFTPLSDLSFTLTVAAAVLLFAELYFLFSFFRMVLPRFSRPKVMRNIIYAFLLLTTISRVYVLLILLLNVRIFISLTSIFQLLSSLAFTAYFIPGLSSLLFGYIFYEIGKERFSYGSGQFLRAFGMLDIALSIPILFVSLFDIANLSSWNAVHYLYYWKVKFFPLVAIWVLDQWNSEVRKQESISD